MKCFFAVFLSLFTVSTVYNQSISDRLIYPDLENKIVLVEQTQGTRQSLKGKIVTPQSNLHKRIIEELSSSYHQQMLKISQCARNLAVNTEGPNLLYLSNQDGGFPRQGLTLTNSKGESTKYNELHFVDLVIDERRIENGALSIYTHELGHVMMNLLH